MSLLKVYNNLNLVKQSCNYIQASMQTQPMLMGEGGKQ